MIRETSKFCSISDNKLLEYYNSKKLKRKLCKTISNLHFQRNISNYTFQITKNFEKRAQILFEERINVSSSPLIFTIYDYEIWSKREISRATCKSKYISR